MATQTIYGAQLITAPTNTNNNDSNYIGKNSEVFAVGDILTAGSDGIYVAGATDSIIGISNVALTMAATNETVAKVKPSYIPIDQDYEFFMGTNSDMSALTSVGVYYSLVAGGTGAQQVDTNGGAKSTTSRVVMCTAVDPGGIGGTGAGSGLRQGNFKFVKVFNVKSNT